MIRGQPSHSCPHQRWPSIWPYPNRIAALEVDGFALRADQQIGNVRNEGVAGNGDQGGVEIQVQLAEVAAKLETLPLDMFEAANATGS